MTVEKEKKKRKRAEDKDKSLIVWQNKFNEIK